MKTYKAWETSDPEFGESLEGEFPTGARAAEVLGKRLAEKAETPSQHYLITVERDDGQRARFMVDRAVHVLYTAGRIR